MLHIFSSQAFSILFLSVVVLKCVNINIEVHSLKNIVHFYHGQHSFLLKNMNFVKFLPTFWCMKKYLWNNLIQSILSELLNSSLFWKGFLNSFHLIYSLLFLGERLYTYRNLNWSTLFTEFCLRTGHFPLYMYVTIR